MSGCETRGSSGFWFAYGNVWPVALLRHSTAQLELAALYCEVEQRAPANDAFEESLHALQRLASRDPLLLAARRLFDRAAALEHACGLRRPSAK